MGINRPAVVGLSHLIDGRGVLEDDERKTATFMISDGPIAELNP